MKMRVIALPGGQIQVFVDEGTFEEAQVATRTILEKMNAAGFPVELSGKIERHRNDVTHVHVQHDVSQNQ